MDVEQPKRDYRLSRAPRKCLMLARMFARACRVFRRPLHAIRCYLTRSPPRGNALRLRSGRLLHLSSNPHDVVTAFVVFCKTDYGRIEPGSVVVDVGANIGTFAVYAAEAGAGAVWAYEPNREAFESLSRNAAEGRPAGVIRPRQYAVAGQDGRTVRIPVRSSPYNAVQPSLERDSGPSDDGRLEDVETISLPTILRANGLDRVDLLKLDCEGAEFEVIPAADDETLARIREIRMEVHDRPPGPLIERLTSAGFRVVYREDNPPNATVWLRRTGEPPPAAPQETTQAPD
jgi:FkbM family methyltransferase